MPSPFPGMDPYLEDSGRWPDFHARFLTYWCDAINDLLPGRYVASLNERVQLVAPPDERDRQIGPDVTISRPGPPNSEGVPSVAVLTAEPLVVPFPTLYVDPPRETFIEIYNLPERALVAVLELLSPSNKVEPGRSDYYAKRNALMLHEVHLVELDLLIRGRRLPAGNPLPPADYYALVSRGDGNQQTHVYRWNVRQPLRQLPVPLLAPDPDIWFDLGAVFTMAYDRGRYARELDYTRPLGLPLSDADKQWVAEQLKAKRT